MHIMMVASENDAIPHAKVGGVADVVRDVPPALAKNGHRVSVIIPNYRGYQHQLITEQVAGVEVDFAGHRETLVLLKIKQADQRAHVEQFLLDHSLFSQSKSVYVNDDPSRPFAKDATKFALLCLGCAELLKQGQLAWPDVLHLHDWHAATLAVLLRYHPDYQALDRLKTVFTVHNLALQGVRPFKGDHSSLFSWYPDLPIATEQLQDPRYPDCYNPMLAAINLADKVHLVSPSYAQEVLKPSQPDKGFFGGEGLEQSLQRACQENRLVGILNGIEYQPQIGMEQPVLSTLLKQTQREVYQWIAAQPSLLSQHYLACERIKSWTEQPIQPHMVLTSIGRVTDQKLWLLCQPYKQGNLLDALLKQLASNNSILILLGSGDPQLEATLTQAMARHSNFLFLNGYGQTLSDELYQLGDLFLMPSSFEPCGISQMLAMYAGQPCLVHGVGGLKDTVTEAHNGFVFAGATVLQQQHALLEALQRAQQCFDDEKKWQRVCDNAKASRYDWQGSIAQYVSLLYSS